LLLAVLVAVAVAGYWGWDRHRARSEWREAESAASRRQFAAAAAHLERFVALRPDDPAGWLQSARTARRRGRFAEAVNFLDRCEKLGGATDATRLERALLAVQQGELGEIDVHLRATVGPDHPDVLLVLEALARGYMAAERWADARQACEMWRALQPDHPWPWLWEGWIAERTDQARHAAECYRRALELDPDDRDARVAVGRTLIQQRQPGPAAEHFEWVLARAPDDVGALLGLARCRIEEGRSAEAEPLIDRALERDPTSLVALHLRGKAAMARRDPAGAERWLRLVVEGEPGDSEPLHLLVLCLRAQGKDAEADPLARRLETLERDLRRLAELRQVIGPRLADPGPCHEAGVIALRVGRTKEGLNLLREALRRQGDHRPTHAALAEFYRNAGDPALAEFHQALAKAP
jgi:tetratricopeptide (TPR) repeat protein